MLRRFLSGPLRFHLRLHLQTPASLLLPPAPPFSVSSVNHTSDFNFLTLRPFSTSGRDGDDGTGDIWKTLDADELKSSLFGDDTSGSDPTDKVNRPMVSDAWGGGSTDDNKVDLFADTEQEGGAGVDKHDLWSFGDEAEEKARLFENLGEGEVGLEGFGGSPVEERENKEELDEVDEAELERREKELREILGLDFLFLMKFTDS